MYKKVIGLSIMMGMAATASADFTASDFSSPISIYNEETIYGSDMAIKSDGTVGFVYGSDEAAHIEYREYNGAVGAAQTVDDTIFFNFGPALAYDSSDNPHVVWHHATAARELLYNTHDGSSWGTPLDLGETRQTQNASIELDASDNIHVLWVARPDFQGDRMRYRTKPNGNPWLAEQAVVNTTDASPFRAPGNLAVSAGGDVHTFTQFRPRTPRQLGTTFSSPFVLTKVTDGSDFSQTRISPTDSTAYPRSGGLESTTEDSMEAVWRGSQLDLAAIQWWPTSAGDASTDTKATGFVNLYLDVLGAGSHQAIEVWGSQTVGLDSSASEVDMAIDADGNHYVFFLAQDQSEVSVNDVLYMQMLDSVGTKVGDLITLAGGEFLDVADLAVDIMGDVISISYIGDTGSGEMTLFYQTLNLSPAIPEPASLAIAAMGMMFTMGRRKR